MFGAKAFARYTPRYVQSGVQLARDGLLRATALPLRQRLLSENYGYAVIVRLINTGSQQRWSAATPQPQLEPPKEKPKLRAPVVLKRAPRKKRIQTEAELSELGFLNVHGFATAKEYNLEALRTAIVVSGLGETKRFNAKDANLELEHNVLYVVGKSTLDVPCEMIIFREGSIVFWNCDATYKDNMLALLRQFEEESYPTDWVSEESESMPYTYVPSSEFDVERDLVSDAAGRKAHAYLQNGRFFITPTDDSVLYKYTISNAITQSIKLGVWESTLENWIDSMGYLTEDVKLGKRLRISRANVLQKTGELYSLRYAVNLSSDLLDAPDFYWDRKELEALYFQVCSYFSIKKRTEVVNKKINHCVEIADLVANKLNDNHHIRLEWIIIMLIMIEVGFEVYHCF